MGLASNRPYRKCAKIVGEVMGNYHPHGDASIYDTLVRHGAGLLRCATRWSTVRATSDRSTAIPRRPCGTPRRGSTRLPNELLADIDKETVDFVPNYDETDEEPTVLPAQIPNLLVNGSAGIAVGMATNMPPHNLREVIDARRSGPSIEQTGRKLDRARSCTALMSQGPDFPTGGYHLRHERASPRRTGPAVAPS